MLNHPLDIRAPKGFLFSRLSAFIAGCFLPLAFAPFDIWPFAIASPAILSWFWHKAIHPKHTFILGFIFGFGFFGMGVSWVYVSIHEFGNTDPPLAVFITLLFIISLSLFLAAQGYFFKRFFKGERLSSYLLGFPAIWVLFEWIRSFLFGGFPWLYLGYAGLNTPLRGYAPWLSVYGVSFAFLVSGGLLLSLLQEKMKIKKRLLLGVLILWILPALLTHMNYTTSLQPTYTVSLVQGNVAPLDKFASEDPLQAVEKIYVRLTESNWNSDLILWPENAIPLPLPYAEPLIAQLNKRVATHNTTLVTGIQTIINNKDYYNSLLTIGSQSGIYHKRHLVPFGEYLPLDNYLRGLINFFDIPMSNFIEGPDTQAPIKMKNITLAPLICYEIDYPELVRSTVRGTNAIVNLSEDGWFGKSIGPHQHLQIAQMRALETGRYVLRATTSGITAIVTPDGALQAEAPPFEATVLNGTFKPREGETPWMIVGLWPFIILLLLAFLLPGRVTTLYAFKIRKSKRN